MPAALPPLKPCRSDLARLPDSIQEIPDYIQCRQRVLDTGGTTVTVEQMAALSQVCFMPDLHPPGALLNRVASRGC